VALWTTKAGLEEWFAPEGTQVEVLALELRVAGALDHVGTAVAEDAVAYLASVGRPRSTRVAGSFVDVVRNERLRIRLIIDFLPGVDPYLYVVELHREGSAVRPDDRCDQEGRGRRTRSPALSCRHSVIARL
jgi:uncharacterized protein YndB with AHSA1/START domain